ncbi:hypothetical protein [Thiolapillus sp.]|uniref:hypothetical protein n=1 Tax=Thiolapillus sp. TaxID=2017437 RepID=UPI003AF55EEB
MSEFCDEYGITPVITYSPYETSLYVCNHPREFINAVTESASDEDLEQLAHAIRQFAYSEGVGLRRVLHVLKDERADRREFEEQEAMK